MSELSQMVLNYYKDKDYDINKIVSEIDKIKIDVLKNYLDNSPDDSLYVIKRSGNLEGYSKDKIARSIKNAADSNGQYLNRSDVDILMEDVSKHMNDLNRKVFKTSEIKEFVKQSLKDEGYGKIYDSYVSYIQV